MLDMTTLQELWMSFTLGESTIQGPQESNVKPTAKSYELNPEIIIFAAKLLSVELIQKIHTSTWRRSVRSATHSNKKEFPPNGSNGIFFHSHSSIKLRDGTHLPQEKLKETGDC